MTKSGTRISLDAAGTALYINSLTIPLPNAHAAPTNDPITKSNRQIITPNPLGFLLAPGVSLAPGGPAKTFDGKIYSLDRNGILSMDSHSAFTLHPPLLLGGATRLASGSTPNPTSPPSDVVTIAGHAITAAATGFVITDGTTLKTVSPGGPAIVENGTTVSLDKVGILEMDSTSVTSLATLPLPTSMITEASTQSTSSSNESFDDGDKKAINSSGKNGSDDNIVPFVNEAVSLSRASLEIALLLGIVTVNTAVYVLS